MSKRRNVKPPDDTKPTALIQGLCLLALVVLYAISAFAKTEVPLPIYAIIAGVLFGIGNIKNIFGGGK